MLYENHQRTDMERYDLLTLVHLISNQSPQKFLQNSSTSYLRVPFFRNTMKLVCQSILYCLSCSICAPWARKTLSFEWLWNNERFYFFLLQLEQTQKQMFWFIRFERELEYISVPEKISIVSSCIAWNNHNEWLRVKQSKDQKLELKSSATFSDEKIKKTEKRIKDFTDDKNITF